MKIAVVGPIGSGKDLIADFLVSEHGFEKHSLSDVLRAELREKGIEPTRKNLQDHGDYVRKNESVDYLARKVCENLDKNGKHVFTAIRNPAEIISLQKYFGEIQVIMVTAPFGKRLSHLQDRDREQDPQSFEALCEIENRDFGVGQEAHAQQNAGCFEMANRVLVNNGSVDDLKEKVVKMLRELS